MGDKLANKKKKAKRSAKVSLKAPMAVAEIQPTQPRAPRK
ncbi:malic enzyme [Marimonas sp. MJW-29]|uniref:Malic enzyme n=1 Tax=Sulfitobacter sediminis TaxID=3234186 RepID=A0ABV3RRD0_9RHOB